MSTVGVGFGFAPQFWQLPHADRQRAVDRINASGIDYVCVSDHVAFRGGNGWDAFIQAAMLVGHGVAVPIHIGVALLPLRHPTLVARQLLDIALGAQAGVVCGVGVGGEDPDEYSMVGLDVTDRGARMDESLPLLRTLLDGEPVDHRGPHVTAVGPGLRSSGGSRVGLLVGGSAPAAIERAAIVDGWIGTFAAVDRWGARAAAVRALHPEAVVAHQLWAGAGPDADSARSFVDDTLTNFYGLPPAWFRRHTPCGTATELAAFLAPWAHAADGRPAADQLTVFAVAATFDEAIDTVAGARRLLHELG